MKRDQLKEYFARVYSQLLVEQDDGGLFGGGEDTEDEEGGDDTEADADDEAADSEGDTETEEEAEPEIEITPDDEIRLGKQLDHSIDSILVDFETDALKSAAIDVDHQEDLEATAAEELDIAVEWWSRPLSNMLFEQEEEESSTSEAQLDIDKFSGDVAHLIKNYDVLLDMEDIIFKKAYSFLEQKYGVDVAKAFEEALIETHSLDFSSQSVEMQDSIDTPIAVGAGGGGGGGLE
jgi:hypothetical protein